MPFGSESPIGFVFRLKGGLGVSGFGLRISRLAFRVRFRVPGFGRQIRRCICPQTSMASHSPLALPLGLAAEALHPHPQTPNLKPSTLNSKL